MFKIIFKKGVLLMLFVMTMHSANAQKFYIETGFSTAFFKDYTNYKGEKTLDLSYEKPKTPYIESGFLFKPFKKIIELDLGVNYSTYQINTAFTSGNIKIPLQYDLNYFSLKTGLNLTAVNWKKIKVQIHSHLSYDWLTYGTQRYNNQFVDIYKDGSLDRTLLRLHRGLKVQYPLSENLETYLIYNVADSFKEINKDSSDGEEYKFATKSVSIGLLFKIQEKTTSKL